MKVKSRIVLATIIVLATLINIAMSIYRTEDIYAFVCNTQNYVGALPLDNLVVNPWFMDGNDPSVTSGNGWMDDGKWTFSTKASQPAPTTPACGHTIKAATVNKPGGLLQPGEFAYVETIVDTDPLDTSFSLEFWMIRVNTSMFAVKVSGSNDQTTWTEVYDTGKISVPFWYQHIEKIVPSTGYEFHKIEYRAMFESGAVKFNGVYFAPENGVLPTPTPTPTPTPSISPTPTPVPCAEII